MLKQKGVGPIVIAIVVHKYQTILVFRSKRPPAGAAVILPVFIRIG
jgi:hypothetical protein